MKKTIAVVLLSAAITANVVAQSVLVIRKNNGTSDSLRISDIQAITFQLDSIPAATSEGLVAYYPFDGNAADSSGNGFDGIVYGATLTADRYGNPTSAYQFNGTTNIIDCGDILDSVFCAPVAKFTVSGWAKAITTGSQYSGGGSVISKSAGSSGPYQWTVGHVDGKIIGEVFSDSAGMQAREYYLSQPAGEWFHFALVFDGSLTSSQRVKIYKNGYSDNQQLYYSSGVVGTSTMPSEQHLTIGAGHPTGSPWYAVNGYNGVMDDVRIFSRALSAADVLAEYFRK